MIEEHSGVQRSCASHACVPLTLCPDAGFEGAEADAEQFGNPLLSDEEEKGDGKEDGNAARKS